MPVCSIASCRASKKKNQPELTLHRFPKNERLKKKWLDSIGEENISPRSKDWYTCSLHFEEKCFNRTLDVIRLHENSVPTIFSTSNKKQLSESFVFCETSNTQEYDVSCTSTVIEEQSSLIKEPSTVMEAPLQLTHQFVETVHKEVLMTLYEKNIDFEPLIVDITKGEQYSSWFLDINPRGEIPVLKVKNEVIPDSTRIIDYLEFYLDPELTPLINVSMDTKVLDNINRFRDMLEALPAGLITVGSFFHPHLSGTPKLPFVLPVREILKSGDLGNSSNLRKLAEEYPKAKSILLYKAEIQDRKHEIITNEEEYTKVLNIIDQVLTHVEEQLKKQPEGNWLCCENFSIADINLAILLQRLWELGYEGRYWEAGKRPLLENYYNRVKQRESFKKTIPSLPVHLKMIVMSQPPAYLGAAGAASIGVVFAVVYIFKKIIH